MLESHQFCEGKTEKGKGNESAGAREEPQAAILSQAIRALGKQWKVRESVSGEKGMTSARTQGRAGVCLLCSANSKDVMSEEEKERGKGGWPTQATTQRGQVTCARSHRRSVVWPGLTHLLTQVNGRFLYTLGPWCPEETSQTWPQTMEVNFAY